MEGRPRGEGGGQGLVSEAAQEAGGEREKGIEGSIRAAGVEIGVEDGEGGRRGKGKGEDREGE